MNSPTLEEEVERQAEISKEKVMDDIPNKPIDIIEIEINDSDCTTSTSKEMPKTMPADAATCACCKELTKKIDKLYHQNEQLVNILAEHTASINRIYNKYIDENALGIFPIMSEEQLNVLDSLLLRNPNPYVLHMKTLLKGNPERYLHDVLGVPILKNFNADGTHGKKALKNFKNVYAALIKALSGFTESPRQKLRVSLHKKREFKEKGRKKSKKVNFDLNDANVKVEAVEIIDE